MNVANLLKIPVLVTRRVTTTDRDEMGDYVVVDHDAPNPWDEITPATWADVLEQYPTWADLTDAPVLYAGYLWQTSAAEDTANTDQQTETFRLALHRSAAGLVDGHDRVTVAGLHYEVIGTPHQATNPRTRAIEYLDMIVRRAR